MKQEKKLIGFGDLSMALRVLVTLGWIVGILWILNFVGGILVALGI